ncbi:hypothetical protein MRX96_040612 [Rhipicephalus microplus]
MRSSAFYKVQDCFDDALLPCPNAAAKEFMNTVLDKIVGEVLSLVCGKYSRGSTACMELPGLAPPDLSSLGSRDLFELAIQNAAILGSRGVLTFRSGETNVNEAYCFTVLLCCVYFAIISSS